MVWYFQVSVSLWVGMASCWLSQLVSQISCHTLHAHSKGRAVSESYNDRHRHSGWLCCSSPNPWGPLCLVNEFHRELGSLLCVVWWFILRSYTTLLFSIAFRKSHLNFAQTRVSLLKHSLSRQLLPCHLFHFVIPYFNGSLATFYCL